MFAKPISMPCFKSIIFFIKIALKLNYFCKKCKIFDGWGHRQQTPVPTAAGSFAPKPPFSGGWGLRPQTPKTAPHCEFLAIRVLSVLVCYARILPTSIKTGFLNITFLCYNIPLRERLFSSCTYQKRKHEIKQKLKMN